MPVTRVIRALLLCLSLTTPLVHADVLHFHFTGVVSNEVLISGYMQSTPNNHPEWVGRAMSGDLLLDLEGVPANYYPSEVVYGKSELYFPYTYWMNFTITNPDGTVVDIPAAMPPVPPPRAEGDDAFTTLADSADRGRFYAQRTLDNGVSYPRQHASLSLLALGADADDLLSGLDYDTLLIDLSAANYENYGLVRNYTSEGVGQEYSFVITSLAREPVAVPEPSSLYGASVGLILLLFMRSGCRRRSSTLTRDSR